VARPAQALQVGVVVGTALSLRLDVVNAGGLLHNAIPEVLLTEFVISLEDASADDLPFSTVSTLVSGLPRLVLSPAFALMGFAVTRWVSGCRTTAANATGLWCAWRHGAYPQVGIFD